MFGITGTRRTRLAIRNSATPRRETVSSISTKSPALWFRRAIDYPALALGGARRLPFVPERARRQVTLSVSVQLLIYLAGAVSIALGFRGVLYFWLLPALLAQPLLRALLLVESTPDAARTGTD
jgi:hypothetical protein